MTVRPTRQLGDPLLRERCREIPDPATQEVGQYIEDLADTLADWVDRTTYGRGIAAPQIGAPVRLVYVRRDRLSAAAGPASPPWVLVNPTIVAYSAATWQPWDGCLSFSVEIFCRVQRSVWVEVQWQSLDGEVHTTRAEGELGELLQHEIDHLDGVLAVDRMTSAHTLCMRSEFERRHRDESSYRQ